MFRGRVETVIESDSFPSPFRPGGLVIALANTPAHAGIAKPPQPMPVCHPGAG